VGTDVGRHRSRGGDLVGQFYDEGLLAERIVQVGSVTLGSGKPLLPRNITSMSLELLSVKQTDAGFVELHNPVPAHTDTSDKPISLAKSERPE